MNNAPAILRSLIIYAICVPLAVIVGFVVTNPMDYSTLGLFGIIALLLISPLLLRWHHPLLILSWNLNMTLFFINGAPSLWLLMVPLSLGISLLGRALNSEMHFIRVPQITWPLMCLIGVVLITAKFTGGIGLHSLGSNVYGGKKYVFLALGVSSYFALTARRIPPERAGLYVGLFFLSGVPGLIGDFISIVPSWAHFVFWLFPPNPNALHELNLGETRLGGLAGAGVAIWSFLMARYGIRGIFLSGKLWRLFMFFLSFSFIFLGGFRFHLIFVGLVFTFQFFAERLHQTRLLPVFALAGILAAVAIVPFASKLPFTIQRTLTILPLQLDPAARQAAQESLDWRINMWKALLPQIPPHLLLGKGLGISPAEFNEMMSGTALESAAGTFDPSQDPLALSYDYHNGPLSVIIPFGIWGCIALLWFWVAGLRVLHCNFRHGDPSLQTINIFLFVEFLVSIIQFMFTGGSLNLDIGKFAGIVGLSIAFNGGMCQPAPQPVPTREAFLRPRGALPGSRPRPAFTQ